jgi:hypothetical protein
MKFGVVFPQWRDEKAARGLHTRPPGRGESGLTRRCPDVLLRLSAGRNYGNVSRVTVRPEPFDLRSGHARGRATGRSWLGTLRRELGRTAHHERVYCVIIPPDDPGVRDDRPTPSPPRRDTLVRSSTPLRRMDPLGCCQHGGLYHPMSKRILPHLPEWAVSKAFSNSSRGK